MTKNNKDAVLRNKNNPFLCTDCGGARILMNRKYLPDYIKEAIKEYPEIRVFSCEKM